MNREEMGKGSGKTLVVRSRGQSMVEFALILPLMVLVVAGIFDLGRAFFASITITNAAREGARYGTLNRGDTTGDFQNICNTARDEALSSHINIDITKITITCGNTSSINQTCQAALTPDHVCPGGESIIVKVEYRYQDMFFQFIVPNGIDMTHQVEMLVP